MAGAGVGPVQYEPVRPLTGASLIYGTDNRTPVADTTQYPYSAIGKVVATFGSSVSSATGVVIAKNTVLTAAHVIFSQTVGWPDSIVFIPGKDGSDEPFGRISVSHWDVPADWTSGTDASLDIAVLTLADSIGGQTGTLPIDVIDGSALSGATLRSAGYPSDLAGGSSMYLAPGPFLGVQGNTLLAGIDTERGQSGSPIWVHAGSDLALVAVLAGIGEVPQSDGQPQEECMGVYITPEVYSWIKATIANNTPRPSNPSGPTASAPQNGICGLGAGQAVLGIGLGLAACFVLRRRV